jgi:hypothetical protein
LASPQPEQISKRPAEDQVPDRKVRPVEPVRQRKLMGIFAALPPVGQAGIYGGRR